jgi:UDP-glucose 4-epimerase
MKLLVPGGAGYIGSHVVKQLLADGHDVTVLDNLSTGHRWAVGDARLVEMDLADFAAVHTLLQAERFDGILHFAASIQVGESVADPLKYYCNNTGNTLNLVEAAVRSGVRNFIFSSTAAVYGTPPGSPIAEDAPLAPINPYGTSKMMSERVIMDACGVSPMRYGILRYFNAAGASPDGDIGEDHDPETHLIPLALRAALGTGAGLKVFGTDYPTPDGTCLRDYVHVSDLALAHTLLLERLEASRESGLYNCGYGHGYSVRQVIESVGRVTGRPVPYTESPRREGDPAELVAGSASLKRDLGWQPRFDDLDTIVAHALNWERRRAGSKETRVQA